MNRLLQKLLSPWGVDSFGVCRFDDCLPLLPCRAQARLPQNPRSVVVGLFPYYTAEYPRRNVARYAVLPDYHQVAGEILSRLARELEEAFPQNSFVPFVDNSPLREVSAAAAAGLGPVGWHGQLISPIYGSHVLIGAVVTDGELPRSAPIDRPVCLECGRCLVACPTGALSEGGRVDVDRCRSHITQKKGELSEWEQEQIAAGGMAWGCDLCTDACPMNAVIPTPIRELYLNPEPLLTEENLDAVRGEKSYGYRGRAVLMRNLSLIKNRS